MNRIDPRLPPAAGRREDGVLAERAAGRTEVSGGLRVLVIEDDPGYREGLIALFRHAPGFELGAQFGSPLVPLLELERAAARGAPPPWDLVLSDVELPDASGIEVARRVKAAYPELPVVLLTVFEEPDTILDAIRAGADGYLLKRAATGEILAGLVRSRQAVRR